MAEKGENLSDVILRLCEERGPEVSVTPQEVAMEMWPPAAEETKGQERWRKLVRPVRSAVIGLARKGEIEILRRKEVVDPHKPFKGVYKMRYLERPDLEIEDGGFDDSSHQDLV